MQVAPLNLRTSGFVLKIKKWCQVSMSHVTRSMILDLPYTGNASNSTLHFHLKAINGPYPSCRREKNSTLREKLLSRNYSLHIESASLFPFKFEHIVQPPRSSLFDGEPQLSLLYELSFGGGLKWWRSSWKGLSFSVPNVSTQKFVIHTLLLITF
jgi:hypothetical protein